jgi:hypothetical protein
MQAICGEQRHRIRTGEPVYLLSSHPHHGLIDLVLCGAALNAIPEAERTLGDSRISGHILIFTGEVSADGTVAFANGPTYRVPTITFLTRLPNAAAQVVGQCLS